MPYSKVPMPVHADPTIRRRMLADFLTLEEMLNAVAIRIMSLQPTPAHYDPSDVKTATIAHREVVSHVGSVLSYAHAHAKQLRHAAAAQAAPRVESRLQKLSNNPCTGIRP